MKSPFDSLQKVSDEILSNLQVREVRASLEYEIRRAEEEEISMVEQSNEVDGLCNGDQVTAILQSELQQLSDSNLKYVQ